MTRDEVEDEVASDDNGGQADAGGDQEGLCASEIGEEEHEGTDHPGLLRRHQTLLRLIEQAREERGSPPLWDVVAARLDEANRQQDAVAPRLNLLDRIRERVDDKTWGLIVDFEWGSAREVVTGIEIGLELGFDHGRMSALVEAQAEDMSGLAATALVARLADLLGDTEAELHDVLLALLAALRATVISAQRRRAEG
ncbi:MAG: hypothetical protein AAGF11_50115 [Myxococcota bacterium]